MAGPRDRVEALSPVLPEINSLVFLLSGGLRPGPRIFFLQKQVQMCEAENTVVIFEITTVFLENLPVYHSHTGGKRRNLCFVVNQVSLVAPKTNSKDKLFWAQHKFVLGLMASSAAALAASFVLLCWLGSAHALPVQTVASGSCVQQWMRMQPFCP